MPGSCSGLTLLRETPGDSDYFKNWDLEKWEESRAINRPTYPFGKDVAEALRDPATPWHLATSTVSPSTIPKQAHDNFLLWIPTVPNIPPSTWLEGDTKQLECVKSPKNQRGSNRTDVQMRARYKKPLSSINRNVFFFHK